MSTTGNGSAVSGGVGPDGSDTVDGLRASICTLCACWIDAGGMKAWHWGIAASKRSLAVDCMICLSLSRCEVCTMILPPRRLNLLEGELISDFFGGGAETASREQRGVFQCVW